MNRFPVTRLLSMMIAAECLAGLSGAQSPDLQQKLAEVKQAAAANKQALAQYTWVEQVTISLKGEEKKQEHFQVRLGPDGKPQKQSLDPPPQQQQAGDSGGGRGGRIKERVVAKKKEEYKDYADSIKSLIDQYVPPDKDLLQQAYQKGNIVVGPQAGAEGQYRLVVSNYIKQGDNLTLVFDKAQKNLVSMSIASYLDEPKDAVNANFQFTSIPEGPGHVSAATINGVSKQLTIAIANSNYQHL